MPSKTTTTTTPPLAFLDQSARLCGWTTLFLKQVLPATLQRKNFHVKRKPDRTFAPEIVFLSEICKKVKVPWAERKREEVVRLLVNRLVTMQVPEIPGKVLENLPSEPWTAVKARDKKVQAELAQVTEGKSKNELMTSFQSFPKSFLQLVHQLRENDLFPDESKAVLWIGDDQNSIVFLNRNNILRVLNKRDTSTWVLPQEFFDADAPQYDGDVPAINNQQGASTSSSLKRKASVLGTVGNGGTNNAATTTTTGSGSRGLDTRLVTAALNALGRQQQQQDGSTASKETAKYWKHREVVEGEHAKRAKMDSEVHRFKILDQMLPTLLDAEKRASMEAALQKQKAEFCQQLLQSGEINSDAGATPSSLSGDGKERDKRDDTSN